MDYNDNTISMDDRIMYMMLDSIRDKINSLQAELEINYLDEITERCIIKIYTTLCKERIYNISYKSNKIPLEGEVYKDKDGYVKIFVSENTETLNRGDILDILATKRK